MTKLKMNQYNAIMSQAADKMAELYDELAALRAERDELREALQKNLETLRIYSYHEYLDAPARARGDEMTKFFRKPKTGELIEYPCGCIYEIIVHRQGKLEFINEMFCVEHDPTLTEHAREHEDEIAEAEE